MIVRSLYFSSITFMLTGHDFEYSDRPYSLGDVTTVQMKLCNITGSGMIVLSKVNTRSIRKTCLEILSLLHSNEYGLKAAYSVSSFVKKFVTYGRVLLCSR